MTDRAATLPLINDRVTELRGKLVESASVSRDISVWVSSLLQLAQLAQSCGDTEAAKIAADMASKLPQLQEVQAAELISHGLTNFSELLGSSSAPAPAQANPSLAQDPELLGDFILESREHLSSIEQNLLGMERGEAGGDAVHAIFRSFHTIKGLAGFLEFAVIQEVAHEVESVLDRVRQGHTAATPAIVDAVLESRDYLGRWLALLESGAASAVPPDLANPDQILARIRACSDVAKEPRADITPEAAPQRTPDAPPPLPAEASGPAPAAQTATPVPGDSGSNNVSARSIKVSTDKLDYLVDMVGEMVIAQSLIRHDPEVGALQSSGLTRNLAQLARITNDVQRTAMSMRMVPIGSLFQKMARLVRDLSRKFNKQIIFETQGEDVELDRNIVEELGDPMMHMVRNAVDHGIETEQERAAAGKPVAARITLRAFHRAGQIVIEVADDGRGINRARVLDKAKRKGLVAPSAVLTDAECMNLIFQPGFSTVDNVSDISGRGVGMDVVRKQISRLRGNIDIVSVQGEGTTFSLRLPLTLAIIDGLVVVVGEERFIIPLASVRELLRPKPEMLSTVENQAELVCIREQLIPMVRLHERFKITPRSTNPSECVLVVADSDGVCFCLMVDEMAGKQEVVIKSLGGVFKQVAGVAGGAILGDGHVGLILDLKGLFGGSRDV